MVRGKEIISTCRKCHGAAMPVKQYNTFWVCGCTICLNCGMAAPTRESAIELWNAVNFPREDEEDEWALKS